MQLASSINSKLKKMTASASRRSIELMQKVQMTEHLFMIIAAVIIGILAGFGAVGIRLLIKEVSDICFAGDGTMLENVTNMAANNWYYVILAPAIGGLIVGPIIYFFAPEAKGHGVPEVMQAVLLKGGFIRSRVAFIKALASSITIGTGGSVGREGPIIQIGASVGSTVGQFFNVSSRRMKTLVGCGAAAGIAAAFNAPVAGALFAVEIVLMDFAVAQFSPIVIASVMATVVSHAFEGGDFAAFHITSVYVLESPYEIGFYFVLGAISGLISWLFIKVLYYFEDLWDDKFKFPNYLKAALGGLMIGALALVFPEIMGVGYDSISAALNNTLSYLDQAIWYLPLALIFIKILAASLTLGSGGSGGIFAPALFMGAMAGAFFGYIVHSLFPEITAAPGAYAIVAMGGMVAGTTRAPITAIIIVFEMTKDYTIMLPLMIVCVISMILSSKLSRESIYTLKLLHRNINIKERAEVNIMKNIHVGDCYQKDFLSLPENTKFDEVVSSVISKKVPYVYVHGMNDELMGIISIHNVKDFMFDKDMLQNVLIAGDIVDKSVVRMNLGDNCKMALDEMAKCNYDGLPVVDSDNPNKQIGIIWRKDIDNAYRKEIDKHELTSDLANKIFLSNASHDVTFMEGYMMTELPAPKEFIGKTIREIDIRAIYGVEVLSINSHTKSGKKVNALPQADYRILAEDALIIAGKKEKINILRTLP